MRTIKAENISQLKKSIVSFQIFKNPLAYNLQKIPLGPLKKAFPNATFPLAGLHEFFYKEVEDRAATSGFIGHIIASLMQRGGASVWIGTDLSVFPQAFQRFGITPDKIIFIPLKKETHILWAVEEALKCEGLSAVIGELAGLSFTASRRLQLAIEQSRVTGFILLKNTRALNTTACVTRWRINHIQTLETDSTGVGFACWNVELLKVKNGNPGQWQIEYVAGELRELPPAIKTILHDLQRKTG